MATATTAVGASFKKLGASLSGVMGRSGGRRDDGGTDTPPQFVGDGHEGYQPYQPPPQQAASNGSGSMRNPGAGAAAEEAAPAPPAAPVVQQHQQQRAEAPTFTLDESESPKP